MTDWHTHILPAMDDGSRDVAESLAMLKLCGEQGVTAVALTPHFYPQKESPARFFRRRDASLDALEAAVSLRKAASPETPVSLEQIACPETPVSLGGSEAELFLPERIPGAEVFFFSQLAQMAEDDLNRLCIGDTKLLMVEMPLENWDESVFSCLEELMYDRNLIPVLAHIDRYFRFIKDVERLEHLIREGLIVQMNAGALLDLWSRKKAIQWILADRVHLLGSDCHNMSTRKPNLGEAYKVLTAKTGEVFSAELFGITRGNYDERE